MAHRARRGKLPSLLLSVNQGHFHTTYDNIEHLKLQFHNQLDKMLEEYD